ncbi:MAG: aspartyl/asparaginyl beta-hydroxylase domain-containing protein [Hellea sp.]|nr:aspartyl/asparaginyl beta-hydroxylase domain-containing protein [Hellea sp.]
MTERTEKPKNLSNPRRRFVKKTGKKLMRTVAKLQSKSSKVPDTPKIDNGNFDFLQSFVDNWEVIRDEALEVLKYREQIPGFQELSPDQYRLAKGQNWKTFVLFGFGQRLEKNTRITPKTAEILEQVPNLQTAMFSILAPGYHIPAHTGVTKGILRSHLGLIIPKDYKKCRIRVEDTITPWREGEIFVFDDTYEHEVWNDTDEERVILLFDFDRPMGFSGRFLNKAMMSAMKKTAFYQDPKKNLEDAEARLEAAIRQNDKNMEAMSDPS